MNIIHSKVIHTTDIKFLRPKSGKRRYRKKTDNAVFSRFIGKENITVV